MISLWSSVDSDFHYNAYLLEQVYSWYLNHFSAFHGQ
jgi:hypothetical protein